MFLPLALFFAQSIPANQVPWPELSPRSRLLLEEASWQASCTVIFKISDRWPGYAEHGRLQATAPELRDVVEALAAERVEPLFPIDPSRLQELRQRALESGAWPPPPDLNQYFRATADRPERARMLVEALRSAAGVEHAYVQPPPAPPPGDLPPTTPDWTSSQSYFAPPGQGIGLTEVAGVLGARGKNVQVTDCEYDWTLDHEDLELGAANLVGGLTPAGLQPEHGSAVLGILCAKDNGYGVTGGVPGAAVRLSTQYSTTHLYDPYRAIANAVAGSGPGDVVLLEMQTSGPIPFTVVPQEWDQACFDLIRTATNAGIHVVEAGANGGVSLDDLLFGGLFILGNRNSGAIVVGAGKAGRAKTAITNFGSRLDCQALGEKLYTAGYGDLFNPADVRQHYTRTFNGTSSASAVVAAATACLIGAMKAHGMTPPSPEALRQAMRSTGDEQPFLDTLLGRIGPRPDMEDLFERFNLPSGLRMPRSAVTGGTITFTFKGNSNETWTLYQALDTALIPTAVGMRVLGNNQFTLLVSGTLGAGGGGSYTTTAPTSTSLIGKEVYFQVYFSSGGSNMRLSNGGALLIR